jgi:hypothetical protein
LFLHSGGVAAVQNINYSVTLSMGAVGAGGAHDGAMDRPRSSRLSNTIHRPPRGSELCDLDQPRAISELNRHCRDAMFGYCAAATAAYGHMLDQSIAAWGRALGVQSRPASRKPASWYRLPDDVDVAPATRYNTFRMPANCNAPMPAAAALTFANEQAIARYAFAFASEAWPMMAMAPWLALANPRFVQCWPMAAGMMAAGVPRSVAWPTAEANAATIDAFKVAVAPATAPLRRSRGDGVNVMADMLLAQACLVAPVPTGLWLNLVGYRRTAGAL